MKEQHTPKIASAPAPKEPAGSEKRGGTLGLKLLTALLFLAAAAYFGIQVYQAVADPLVCAVAYRYQAEDAVSVTGFLVRDELALGDSGGGLLRLTRREGERVSAGGTVAQVYSDRDALDRQTEIDRLQTQLDQLITRRRRRLPARRRSSWTDRSRKSCSPCAAAWQPADWKARRTRRTSWRR